MRHSSYLSGSRRFIRRRSHGGMKRKEAVKKREIKEKKRIKRRCRSGCCLTFKEVKYKVKTHHHEQFLPLEDIRYSIQYVYAVHNLGNAPAFVSVQVGTRQGRMAHDIGPELIPPHETKIITPLRFSKFIQLIYRSAEESRNTKLQIVFQSQNQR